MSIKDIFRKKAIETEEEEFIQTIEAHNRNKRIRRLLIALIILISVISVVVYQKTRVYKGLKIESSVEIQDGYDSKYTGYGDMLIKYSEDGVSYISKNKTVWNQAFEIKTPLVDSCGDYVVVATQGGTDIYLFNKKGLVSQYESSYPIIKVKVAKQGVVAAILEDSNTNYLEVTDKEGNKLVAGRTELTSNGYPVDFDISEDGKKMAVSYLYVSSGVMQSKVLFYNFSDVGQNEVDRMVGGFNHYAQSVVPKVEFLTNDVVVAVADSRVSFYSMKQKPELVSEEEFSDEIEKICYSSEYLCMVFKNTGEQNKEEHLVCVYNTKGKKVMSEYTDELYENVKIIEDYVFTYDNVNFTVLAFNGDKKLTYSFKEEVVDILPVTYRNFYVVYNDRVEYVKLR